MRVNLVKDNILKALIVFAMPILISNIFQQLYNTMDTMIIGNILGDKSLAAIGACAAVYELLIGFALGIGNGLSIVIARAYGAGDKKLQDRYVYAIGKVGDSVKLLLDPDKLLNDDDMSVIEKVTGTEEKESKQYEE